MRVPRSIFITVLLVVLLAFTTSIALAQDPEPPEPTDPEETTEQTEREPGQNPVAWFLAQYFLTENEDIVWDLGLPEESVPPEGSELPEGSETQEDAELTVAEMYEYIMGLHEDYGFGNLARAFYLYSKINAMEFPEEDGELPDLFADIGSFEDLLALRESYGWGVLYKSLDGVHPSEGSLGWAFKNAKEADKPGNGPPEWAHKTTTPDENGDTEDTGETEVTVAGGKPDKPGKPTKADNPNKPDHAGPKDKKNPKDK